MAERISDDFDDYDGDSENMEEKREAFAISASLNLRHLEQLLEKVVKIEKQLMDTMPASEPVSTPSPSPSPSPVLNQLHQEEPINRVSTTDYYCPGKEVELLREPKRARLS